MNKENQPAKAPPSDKAQEGLSLLIGKDVQALEKELGKPQRVDPSIYGYEWYIYNLNDRSYAQVGVENNRVVTVYAIGQDLDVAPFEIGQPVEEIFNTHYIDANIDIKLNGNTYRFELNDTDLNLRPLIQLGDIYAQLYIDKFTGTLSSVRFLDAETIIKQRPYGLVYRGQLIEPQKPSESLWRSVEVGEEKEIFDLTNVLRIRHDLKPLKWDEKTAQVAYEHSKDMAINDDFSHTSKKFGSLSDRLKTAKVVFQTAGENIAANYSDGPAVVEGWLNSKSHRDSLLNKDFTYLGVGVYQKYYTQNFIQKWEQ
ncbi:CAP domain-containing protein [Bacillota bacterium Lsc_1132]